MPVGRPICRCYGVRSGRLGTPDATRSSSANCASEERASPLGYLGDEQTDRGEIRAGPMDDCSRIAGSTRPETALSGETMGTWS